MYTLALFVISGLLVQTNHDQASDFKLGNLAERKYAASPLSTMQGLEFGIARKENPHSDQEGINKSELPKTRFSQSRDLALPEAFPNQRAITKFIHEFRASIKKCWQPAQNFKKITLVVRLDSEGKLVGKPTLAKPVADPKNIPNATAAINAIAKCKLPRREDRGRIKELDEFEMDLETREVPAQSIR